MGRERETDGQTGKQTDRQDEIGSGRVKRWGRIDNNI